MSALNIETLKAICNKVPGEYTIRVKTATGQLIDISDKIEIDITDGTLTLKE